MFVSQQFEVHRIQRFFFAPKEHQFLFERHFVRLGRGGHDGAARFAQRQQIIRQAARNPPPQISQLLLDFKRDGGGLVDIHELQQLRPRTNHCTNGRLCPATAAAAQSQPGRIGGLPELRLDREQWRRPRF